MLEGRELHKGVKKKSRESPRITLGSLCHKTVHPRGLNGRVPSTHTKLEIMPIPINQSVKIYNSQGIGQSTQKGSCLSCGK